MEKAICCLLLVAMTTALTSGTYYSMPGLGTGYGWGYGIGHPLLGMGWKLAGMGIGHKGFPLPLGIGHHYHPLSYSLYGGAGFGSGYGYYPRTYSGYSSNYGGYLGGYGYSNGLYNSGFSGGGRGDDDFSPYSGIEDWDLNGFG